MNIVYLSGHIAADPETAPRRFHEAEKQCLAAGAHTVYNPIVLGNLLALKLGRQPTQEEYLEYELQYLLQSDTVVMLDGWQDKKTAAKEEYYVAKLTGKKIVEQKDIPYLTLTEC